MASKGAVVAMATTAMLVLGACSSSTTPDGLSPDKGADAGSDQSSSGGDVTLEFAQWWEPELPAGEFRKLMDTFEKQNPKIKVKLLSGPYASTKEQTVAGAAAGTMSDVVGLDGAWISDFVKQGSLANLSQLMADAQFDESQLASQVAIDQVTYMIPVVNFIYPMFYNDELLAKASVTPPKTREEFAEAAKKISKADPNVAGWVLPLSTEAPNGIQNDVMSWVWASGGSMLKDGKPNVNNTEVASAIEFVKDLYDAKAIAPGALTMKEQDKVEEFTNGRVAMMIDSLAHITMIREKNPNLKFTVAAVPPVAGYSGKSGITYASWGIGIAENSKHKAEALKLVKFLMSQETNAKISSIAYAFPGNKQSVPDFVGSDEAFKTAFDIYRNSLPTNEFTGLPVAEQLMREFSEQLQQVLDGGLAVDAALAASQQAWEKHF